MFCGLLDYFFSLPHVVVSAALLENLGGAAAFPPASKPFSSSTPVPSHARRLPEVADERGAAEV